MFVSLSFYIYIGVIFVMNRNKFCITKPKKQYNYRYRVYNRLCQLRLKNYAGIIDPSVKMKIATPPIVYVY